MNLRPATVADEKLLLDWRNDPTVVEMLHDPRPITPQEHGKWLRRILLMDHCEMRLFVAEVDGVPVGQGRIERSWKTLSPKTDTCHLGYSLGKEWRGKGYGVELVARLVGAARVHRYATVACRIKRTNTRSVLTATRAGVDVIELF
jgi:UDP-2,4-diacetamido-2,4,6-trideoxy-beta-L-altropyranose hydrolase